MGLKTLSDQFQEVGADFGEEIDRRASDSKMILETALKSGLPADMLWKPSGGISNMSGSGADGANRPAWLRLEVRNCSCRPSGDLRALLMYLSRFGGLKAPSSVDLGLTVLASIIMAAHSEAAVNVEFVTVGNAWNAADTTGYGSVAYEYKIAKNETTVGQYCEFLNAMAKSDAYCLYSTIMASRCEIAGISRSASAGSYSYAVIGSTANKPITYVSWFDAARFRNWLHNSQGSGSTETGAYTRNGAMSGIYTLNPGAQTWKPSENEWY